jgi:hypothetical protein
MIMKLKEEDRAHGDCRARKNGKGKDILVTGRGGP